MLIELGVIFIKINMTTPRNNFSNIPEVILATILVFLENEEILSMIDVLGKIRRITRLILPYNLLFYDCCKRKDLIRANKITCLQRLKVEYYLPKDIKDSSLLSCLSHLTSLHLCSGGKDSISNNILSYISFLTRLTSLKLEGYYIFDSILEDQICKLTRLTYPNISHKGNPSLLSKSFLPIGITSLCLTILFLKEKY